MIFFAKNQISEEAARNNMILISLMKFISTLFTEIANILLISSENTSIEIIRSCVALRIIAELDSLFA